MIRVTEYWLSSGWLAVTISLDVDICNPLSIKQWVLSEAYNNIADNEELGSS